MKILFLSPEYPHARTGPSGGIGTSIKNLALALTNANQKASVMVYGQSEDEVFQDGNIEVYRIKNIKLKGISWWLTQKKVQNAIHKLIVQQKADVVEVVDWTGFSAFINLPCPIVMRLHGSDTYFCHLDQRPAKWFNRFLEKRAFKKADAILSVSEFTGQLTNTLFVTKRNFEVIPNGLSVSSFPMVADESSTPTILYLGTLIRKKGMLELPMIFNKVVSRLPEATLVLIGKDSPDAISGNASTWEMMEPLFDKAARSNVQYLGAIPHEAVAEEYQKAMVCVFPSFAEAFPVSWLEAMGSGKAVVASNIGWANEMIENQKEGFLVDPKEHDIFAGAICRLLEDDALRMKIGQQARLKVDEAFNIAEIAKRNIRFYEKVIANASRI